MKLAPVVLALVLAAAAGCGADTPEDAGVPAEPAETRQEGLPDEPLGDADAYALERSGGVRTGCLTADDPATDPGCIYSAAFAGCTEAITGASLGDMPYTEEFPEPELQAVYEQALEDCADR